MSEQSTVEFTSLEDLFLSSEFGRPRAGGTNLDLEPDPVHALFGGSPVRAPLVPLAPLTGTPAGVWGTSGSGIVHSTSTHIRRNRTFAAMSGAAAALLVAVGLAGSLGHSNKPSINSAAGKITVPTTPVKTGGGGNGNGTTPTGTSSPTGATSVGTGSGNSAHGVSGGGNATVVDVIPPSTIPGVTTNPPPPSGTTPTVTTTPPPPATGAKTGLVPLVGSVVSTVGTTVNGVSDDVSTTVPALTPVGDLGDSVGGTVVDLGDMLSGLST